MTYKESHLGVLPAGYDDSQKSKKVLEEFPVEFDCLFLCNFAFAGDSRSALPYLCLPLCGGFLLVDCISYSVDESNKEGEVNCPRYIGSMT